MKLETKDGMAFVDGDLIQHHQMDAINMSGSAIVHMVSIRYRIWERYWSLHAAYIKEGNEQETSYYKGLLEREERVLRKVCELVSEAMNYIGDVNNGTDAVDEYKMTDAAFAAMCRALADKSESDQC